MSSPDSKTVNALLFLIIILLFNGCKKEEEPLKLNTLSRNMTTGETFRLNITPGIAGCVFESENELIASVSYEGIITANHIGEIHILVSYPEKGFSAKCKVTVAPKYLMFREPYLGFGDGRQNIILYETRYYYAEDNSTIIYAGENSSIYAVYYFLENSSYATSACLIPSGVADQLFNYLGERYVLLVSDDQFTTMKTTDSKTMIGIEPGIQIYSQTYYAIYYAPYPDSKSDIFKSKSDWIKGRFSNARRHAFIRK